MNQSTIQHILRYRRMSTAKYHKYLKSPGWKRKALKYKQKYPICEVCRKNKSEHVHHTHYSSVGNEKGFDLIAICSLCHKAKHSIK